MKLKTLTTLTLVAVALHVFPKFSPAPDCSGTGSKFTLYRVSQACDLTDPDHPGTSACKQLLDGTEKGFIIGRPETSGALTVTSADQKCAKKYDTGTGTWVDDSTNYPVTGGTREYKGRTSMLVSAGGPGLQPRTSTTHIFPEDTGLALPDPGDRFGCVEDLQLNCENNTAEGAFKYRKMRVKP